MKTKKKNNNTRVKEFTSEGSFVDDIVSRVSLPAKQVEGRADTTDKKIAFLLRLFDLWRAYPSLRFGQMLEAAISDRNELFFIEDEVFINTLEKALKELIR